MMADTIDVDDLVKQLRVGSIWGQSVQVTLTNWRLERQEAADRIEQLVATNEELEEKLLSATMDGYDMAKHEYRDRIEQLVAINEELEAKLAKVYQMAWEDSRDGDYHEHPFNAPTPTAEELMARIQTGEE